MHEYSQWEFLLDGNMQEFRNLSQRRGTRFFDVQGGIDDWLDCPNDDFRMTTLYCDENDDGNIAWQVGNELISLFNGASILFKRNYRKASIYGLLSNGRGSLSHSWQASHDSSKPPALLGAPKCSSEEVEAELNQAKILGIKFWLLHLATVNQDVYFILKYLDREPNWTNYNSLLETIEFFAKKNSFELPLTHGERKDFGNTANNFSLSGFDSRHGFKELAKKKCPKPMSIIDGYNIITKAAKSYLKFMYLS